jgi:hypothetical protein
VDHFLFRTTTNLDLVNDDIKSIRDNAKVEDSFCVL